jgi:3-hydroxyacyl-CoA dehydrogenase
MFVFRAAVVGAGTMGGEIAQVIASAGVPVVLKDVEDRFVEQGLAKAREVSEQQVRGLVKKGALDESDAAGEVEQVVERITGTTTYDDFGDVDFVIEAVPEKMEIKRVVLGEIDTAAPSHAIISSNTSSLSVSEMAEATGRPGRFVGFHFFYPASQAKLIEVIPGARTTPKTTRVAMGFAQDIRKQPVRCVDSAGFVVNRILMAGIAEMWLTQHEEALDPMAIDAAVMTTKTAPMGPFFLSDLLGLDTVTHVAEHLRDSLGDRFYVSREILDLVEGGNLGQKTGRGFYEHGA